MSVRRRFLPVTPVGLGTFDVESPRSVLLRLAKRNHCSTRELLDFQCSKVGVELPRANNNYIDMKCVRKADMANKHTPAILKCLADACRIPLERMEMTSMSRFEHLFHKGLAREDVWCCPLMCSMRDEDDWYEKLLWNIRGIYFDSDLTPLTNYCPVCRKKLKSFTWGYKIGRCIHRKGKKSCDVPIDAYIESPPNNETELHGWSKVEYAKWATNKTKELLLIGNEARNFNFHDSFRHYYKSSGFTSYNAAQRKLGIDHVTIAGWLKGNGRITYDKFLILLFAYDITPFDFFSQRRLAIPNGSCPTLRPSPFSPISKTVKRRSYIDRIAVREGIMKDLKSEEYIRMAFSAYLEHRFNHPVGSLRHFTSDLRKIHNHKRRKFTEGKQRIDAVKRIAEIEESYRICVDRGVSFTRREVEKILPQPGILMNKWVTKLMRDIRAGRHKVAPQPPCYEDIMLDSSKLKRHQKSKQRVN